MAYRLEAHIDDMSRSEAAAVVTAIVQTHGSKLVKEILAMLEVKEQNQEIKEPYSC